MEFRYLGNSGLEDLRDHLRQLAHPRLPGRERRGDASASAPRWTPASPPSTPPTSTPTPRPRPCSARRCKGERRESLEIFTKVYWPTGPSGPNDTGLSRKHIMESINGSLRAAAAPTTSTSTRRTATTPRRRWRRPCRPSPTSSGPARRSTSGSASGPPTSCAPAHALAKELGFQLISSQPQYSMLWRVIEDEVVPASRELGHLPDRLVADRPGRADRQVPAGPAAAGRLAGHRREGRRPHDPAVHERRTCSTGCSSCARSRSRWT